MVQSINRISLETSFPKIPFCSCSFLRYHRSINSTIVYKTYLDLTSWYCLTKADFSFWIPIFFIVLIYSKYHFSRFYPYWKIPSRYFYCMQWLILPFPTFISLEFSLALKYSVFFKFLVSPYLEFFTHICSIIIVVCNVVLAICKYARV